MRWSERANVNENFTLYNSKLQSNTHWQIVINIYNNCPILSYVMVNKSQQQIVDTLGKQIQGLNNTQWVRFCTQTTLWVIDTQTKLFSSLQQDKYLLLEKSTPNSAWLRDFPGGWFEIQEWHEQKLNPQGIILAAIREVEEETLGLVTLTSNNYIDVYSLNTFTAHQQPHIQFRLLAKINWDKLKNITKNFHNNRKERNKEHEIEHAKCSLFAYSDAIQLPLLDSTRKSLEGHHQLKEAGFYSDTVG